MTVQWSVPFVIHSVIITGFCYADEPSCVMSGMMSGLCPYAVEPPIRRREQGEIASKVHAYQEEIILITSECWTKTHPFETTWSNGWWMVGCELFGVALGVVLIKDET